ncbi:phage protease [Piscinibacter koreensis]|uniref:Mu-like prophage I protein n=1 Tax=Piscinibacter koreensis TaxID=2742824 RepID=A0A7Y6NTC9_9BURK|nr:phage protease [Schlegelella koreensis]NUZ08939.1 hypothetical protein [Schlegelella koreensis]
MSHQALLATALALAANGEAQLLPAGEFKARDGRPGKDLTWKLDDTGGVKLAVRLNGTAASTPIVIDYEHQTMLAPENGKPAPAAGWITHVEWRVGQGLFSRVDWTAAARQRIAAKEYRFISPVIEYDRATGQITGLHNAALTNFPALLGMQPVVAQLRAGAGGADVWHGQRSVPPEIAALVEQGVREHKLTPQLRAWAEGFGAADAASLRTYLASVPVGRYLDDEVRTLLLTLGVTVEQFVAGGGANHLVKARST